MLEEGIFNNLATQIWFLQKATWSIKAVINDLWAINKTITYNLLNSL